MILREGPLQFDFSDAKAAFKFDEQDRSASAYHGLSHCMKAVDFLVEYDDHYLFIEVKIPRSPARYASEHDISDLIKNLTQKFRDTFLYRWAEDKLDKPVHYHCLIELDNAQTLHLMHQLKRHLPTERCPIRWQRPLAHVCTVANRETWNAVFPNIQVRHVPDGAA